jgi:hypothetical protein
MFDPNSRYYNLDTAVYETQDGRRISYKRRRFLPDAERLQTLTQATVTDGDRLDLITAKTLGNSEQFWRICDAESSMRPESLTEEPGRKLRVPLPQVET